MAKKIEPKVETQAKTSVKPSKSSSKTTKPAAPTSGSPVLSKKPPCNAKVPVKVSKNVANPKPTAEEISIQAYYVAEKRMAAGFPGDTTSDWLQAEKELLEK